jgi:glutaredoxin-like YruB-family protein
MIPVNSYKDFKEKTQNTNSFWLFIYKKTSEQSDCAFQSILKTEEQSENKPIIYFADVNEVKDIHENYEVKSVPSLLKFESNEFKGVYKGCNDDSYYTALFSGSVYKTKVNSDAPTQKSVSVYSTPSCSWCNRIKTYFKEKNIKFRDIDVSKDQKAAEEMVKRSGQQGVPQTLIGGQVVVGFDKAKIDNLLGL